VDGELGSLLILVLGAKNGEKCVEYLRWYCLKMLEGEDKSKKMFLWRFCGPWERPFCSICYLFMY
jgi:hypothetical protein